MNLGLLLLRVVTGLLLAAHGLQKTSFRLGGTGLAGGVAEFRDDGFRGGAATALAAGLGQLLSGSLFALGALTPLAAATAVGVMTVAVTVKWAHGPWAPHDGYEYPGYLVAVPAALAFTGPGGWSVDRVLGHAVWPVTAGAAAVAVGLLAGLLTRLALHRGQAVAGPAEP
ncbi:DoxX family protein, partial [Streptacidiphilus anmyonensis]|uniref:DoxX family protein n=1 Tax=Streptacidiphilus anmyonensis TaxID=405782 RepID=UPI0005A76EB6